MSSTTAPEITERPDPTIDVDFIKKVFDADRDGAWTFVSHRSSAWLRSFKALVKEYILETPFYDTMPALHRTAMRVNAKLDVLIPYGDANQFSTNCTLLMQDMMSPSMSEEVVTTYSDPWVGQVVLYLLAKEIDQHVDAGYEARR